jgi:hypothetical protein
MFYFIAINKFCFDDIFYLYIVINDVIQVKSSLLKLEIIIRFYRKIIQLINSSEYNLLVKFTVYILIKINTSRLKSNIIFIKIFKLKSLISSEGEYYLSIILKAIELIENEFGISTNKSENTNSLIQFKKEEIEEFLIEFDKHEFLERRFLSTKQSILNASSKFILYFYNLLYKFLYFLLSKSYDIKYFSH